MTILFMNNICLNSVILCIGYYTEVIYKHLVRITTIHVHIMKSWHHYYEIS